MSTLDVVLAPARTFAGIVRQRIFRGARNVYTVEVGAFQVTIDAPPDQTVAAGSEVTLVVDPAHTWAVR